jgi:hypothetical protein
LSKQKPSELKSRRFFYTSQFQTDRIKKFAKIYPASKKLFTSRGLSIPFVQFPYREAHFIIIPHIISIPFAVITLGVISLLAQKDNSTKDFSK